MSDLYLGCSQFHSVSGYALLSEIAALPAYGRYPPPAVGRRTSPLASEDECGLMLCRECPSAWTLPEPLGHQSGSSEVIEAITCKLGIPRKAFFTC